ncbi:hypothetical protein SAMN05878276_1398 [Aquipseudomonas alcaligenes]|uniref:P-loop ATPase, Sll1717 family n=1 Tax=Aquipseudomonas alcaligenes TaxID=43263 RepID=UPI0009553FB5|nr:hypothetical protein [Pseudomonas alcaligenes]SIR98477.1 hypothetical protein SAMN05878276_1398 [Pseudomonas alcaligenes]
MIKLSDIYLGNIDAKNELLNNSPEERNRFKTSFVSPPNLVTEKFIEKEKYFVTGLKGTGKTALLRYISIALDDLPNSSSHFMLFKTDVDEDTRKEFSKASRVQVADSNSESFDGDDFEMVWRWFIYRKIAEAISEGSSEVFQKNANLEKFIELVNSEYRSDKKQGLMRLIPTIRKGTIEISNSPKLGLELDWNEAGTAKIQFNDLVRKADTAFNALQQENDRLNIFFDELELNYNTQKQYQRDARLVRDLIVSVEKINAIAKSKGFNLCLYAAIRSEVQTAVSSLGKEINKALLGFGTEILWNRPGIDDSQQPLLFIIEQRINNARESAGLERLPSNSLWENYFPKDIQGKKPQTYILHNSWYRPRDVVRLLMIAQTQYPNEKTFKHEAFDSIRKNYSRDSWVEITEELKSKYRMEEIEGIKTFLYGYKQIFSRAEALSRSENVSQDHEEADTLFKKTKINTLLKDLFRIGAIGNIHPHNRKMRFSFRGDDEILLDQDAFVHNALKAHLSIYP